MGMLFHFDKSIKKSIPKNKTEVDSNDIAGVDPKSTTNRVQMASLKKLALIQQGILVMKLSAYSGVEHWVLYGFM